MLDKLNLLAYHYKDSIVLVSLSLNEAFDVVSELPPTFIKFDEEDGMVGKAVLTAVEKCREKATEGGTHVDVIAQAIGEKTDVALNKKTTFSLIARLDGANHFLIYPGQRRRGGFEFTKLYFEAVIDNPELIGEALKKSLQTYP